MIKIGSKVVCIDNTRMSSVNDISLTLGRIYTVDGMRELHRGTGVSLKEKPSLIRIVNRRTGARWIDRQWFHINRFLDITELETEKHKNESTTI